mmetsp:Transcript_3947/g.11437  ORF Transcript_3947/g.11437 Transcript_3947/m.11437 type:complete len:547 (+) Transcript_3947:95-1735(+)
MSVRLYSVAGGKGRTTHVRSKSSGTIRSGVEVADERLRGEHRCAEGAERHHARRARGCDDTHHGEDGRVHGDVAIPEGFLIQLRARGRRPPERAHLEAFQDHARLGRVAHVVKVLRRVTPRHIRKHLASARVPRRVLCHVVHHATDSDPHVVGLVVLRKRLHRHLTLRLAAGRLRRDQRRLRLGARAVRCLRLHQVVGRGLLLDAVHELRAPRLARAEGPVPEAARGAEGVVAALGALVVQVVVVGHLRVGQEALQVVRHVEGGGRARVLLQALHDAQEDVHVVGGVVQGHHDLRKGVPVDGVHEVVEKVRLVGDAGERVRRLVVAAVDVLPEPRNHVACAVRPVHGEAEHVLVHQQACPALQPRVLRAGRARVETGVEVHHGDGEDAVHQQGHAVVPVLALKVLQKAAGDVRLGLERVVRLRLRAEVGKLGVHVLEVSVVHAGEEGRGGHHQTHVHQRRGSRRRREGARRVRRAHGDDGKAHAKLNCRIQRRAAKEERGEVLQLLLLALVEGELRSRWDRPCSLDGLLECCLALGAQLDDSFGRW